MRCFNIRVYGSNHTCGPLMSKSAAMANLTILTKSCHSHNGDEFGKISSNSQMHANKLNTWKPAKLVDLCKCERVPGEQEILN